jgi:hypothetical protein
VRLFVCKGAAGAVYFELLNLSMWSEVREHHWPTTVRVRVSRRNTSYDDEPSVGCLGASRKKKGFSLLLQQAVREERRRAAAARPPAARVCSRAASQENQQKQLEANPNPNLE